MADSCSTKDPIEIIINYTIDGLIEILENRRSQLISDVRKKREEIELGVKTREHMKKQLKLSMLQVGTNLRENRLQTLEKRVVDEMQQKMKDIEIEEQDILSLKLICDTNELKAGLTNLGEIITIRENLSTKYENFSPRLAFGPFGRAPGEFAYPESVTVNTPSKEIFIADSENGRVQVFSEDGMYIREFGKCYFKLPYGIAISDSSIFVSDWGHHCIFKFTLSDLKFVKSVGKKGRAEMEFNMPRQMTVSEGGALLVADCQNNRIGVFDRKLESVWHIMHKKLSLPSDLKTAKEKIYVLSSRSNPCMNIFTLEGEYIRSIFPQGPKSYIIKARYFCFDSDSNFVISDHEANNIKIFSQEGRLLQTLGKEGLRKGTFHQPQGVAMSSSGGIISVSNNNNFGLQIFS